MYIYAQMCSGSLLWDRDGIFFWGGEWILCSNLFFIFSAPEKRPRPGKANVDSTQWALFGHHLDAVTPSQPENNNSNNGKTSYVGTIHVCIYTYMHACMHECIHTYTHICGYECIYMCMYVYMYVHMFMYMLPKTRGQLGSASPGLSLVHPYN